jgi:hypothetical protein
MFMFQSLQASPKKPESCLVKFRFESRKAIQASLTTSPAIVLREVRYLFTWLVPDDAYYSEDPYKKVDRKYVGSM